MSFPLANGSADGAAPSNCRAVVRRSPARFTGLASIQPGALARGAVRSRGGAHAHAVWAYAAVPKSSRYGGALECREVGRDHVHAIENLANAGMLRRDFGVVEGKVAGSMASAAPWGLAFIQPGASARGEVGYPTQLRKPPARPALKRRAEK